MPHAFELPRMWRTVVPLMRPRRAVVHELVPDDFPRLAAVARPLHCLAEPAARLRRVDPIRIDRRSFQVIHLPAAEMRSRDVPRVAFAVGRQDERAFLRSHEHTYTTHRSTPPRVRRTGKAEIDIRCSSQFQYSANASSG